MNNTIEEKLGYILRSLANKVEWCVNPELLSRATVDREKEDEAVDEAKQAILDWHNKQVEEAMAKFHLKKGVKYDVKASNSVIVITHTNKLKDRDDDQL